MCSLPDRPSLSSQFKKIAEIHNGTADVYSLLKRLQMSKGEYVAALGSLVREKGSRFRSTVASVEARAVVPLENAIRRRRGQ